MERAAAHSYAAVDVHEALRAQILREGLCAGYPESEISGSLNNLKPEKISLWEKFNT